MAKDLPNWKPANRWERLKWARLAAGYESAKEAFAAFGWDSIDTYRSHERPPRGDSHGFKEDWGERYARAFKVDFLWLMHGTGEAKLAQRSPPHEIEWQRMTPADRELAIELYKTARKRP